MGRKKPNKKPQPAPSNVATVTETEIQKVEDQPEAGPAKIEVKAEPTPEVSSRRISSKRKNMSEVASELNKLDLNQEKA